MPQRVRDTENPPMSFHEILFPLDIALKSAGGPERRTEIVNFGCGNGAPSAFRLAKTYGSGFAPYTREIAKPVAGSVRIAVGGSELAGSAFSVDSATGVVTFLTGHIPAAGAAITAGFLFDVPVRFDTDYLEVDLSAFAAGAIPKIPLVEIRVSPRFSRAARRDTR